MSPLLIQLAYNNEATSRSAVLYGEQCPLWEQHPPEVQKSTKEDLCMPVFIKTGLNDRYCKNYEIA
jgi:hypothetical protein